jgi:2-dehydro-3-deoxyglucarate aldolase
MNVKEKNILLKKFRNKLNKKHVLSGWMQICSAEIAEILSQKNFDSITLDLEHGSFDIHKLNDIFRAIESEKKISLVRLANHKTDDLGLIFDAGCSGIIIPNVSSPDEVKKIYDQCVWPPKGKRGVGFSRANQYGNFFENYKSHKPILIAMIENIKSISNLDSILELDELDAILIGPYDLSSSLGKPGNFKNINFKLALKKIINKCKKFKKPVGIHVVEPSEKLLKKRIKEGYKFLPFGIDTVLLNKSLNMKL